MRNTNLTQILIIIIRMIYNFTNSDFKPTCVIASYTIDGLCRLRQTDRHTSHHNSTVLATAMIQTFECLWTTEQIE